MAQTAKSIIKASLRKLGVIAVGEEPSAVEAMDALHCLNAMIGSWNLDPLLSVYAKSKTAFTLTADDGEYTIGTDGDIDVTEPETIVDASIISSDGTNEAALAVLSSSQWAQIPDKTQTGIPTSIYLQRSPTDGLGTIFLHPIPDAAHTLNLYLNSQLAEIPETNAGLVTEYELLDGYLRAIEFNLAVELAPEYGLSASQELVAIANEARAKVKRANVEPISMACDSALLGCPTGYVNSNAFNNGGY